MRPSSEHHPPWVSTRAALLSKFDEDPLQFIQCVLQAVESAQYACPGAVAIRLLEIVTERAKPRAWESDFLVRFLNSLEASVHALSKEEFEWELGHQKFLS
jgi:hypothetical protein